MQNNRTFGARAITLRFLLPYMLVLLIPLIIGMITHNKMVTVMEEESTNSNIRILEQSKDTLDRRLQEIDSIVNQLINKQSIVNFQTVVNPFAGITTYKTLEASRELYDYKLSNNFIYDYYIYYNKSRFVLSANMSYAFDSFYNNMYSYEDMSAKEWEETLATRYFNKQYLPSKPMMIKNKPRSMVTYVQSLGITQVPRGAVVVLIDNEQIRKMLGGLNIGEKGWAYIADKDGHMISHISADGRLIEPITPQPNSNGLIEQDDMTITYTSSDYNGWKYVVAQPTAVVLDKVNSIKKTTLAFTLISLLAGLFIAVVLAYRSGKPLRTIVRTVIERFEGGHMPSGDAYGLIAGTLSRLKNDNDALTTKIKEQIPVLRQTFFGHLLKGEFTSEREIERDLRQVGFELKESVYAVILIYLRHLRGENEPYDLEELMRTKVLAKEALEAAAGAGGHVYDVNEEQFVLLLPCGDEDGTPNRDRVREAADLAAANMPKRTNMHVIMAVGGLVCCITDISRSYEEAQKTLQHHVFHRNDACIWYDEITDHTTKYDYSADMEMRLVNAVRAGEGKEVRKLLDQLYRVNFEERRLTIPVLRMFLYELIATVAKLTEHLHKEDDGGDSMDQLLEKMEASKDLGGIFPSITEAFVQISRDFEERKRSNTMIQKKNIVDYIDREYHNPDISLTMVAERFNLSETYLSSLFKEQTGINFSDYLEFIRMDKAKWLLCESDLPVGEIARQVGYGSANTFGRAFKRIHGVNATVFKKSGLINDG